MGKEEGKREERKKGRKEGKKKGRLYLGSQFCLKIKQKSAVV